MPKDPVLDAKSRSIWNNSLFSGMGRVLEFECGTGGETEMIDLATVTRRRGGDERT